LEGIKKNFCVGEETKGSPESDVPKPVPSIRGGVFGLLYKQIFLPAAEMFSLIETYILNF
jgi:hypothetical protein